MENVIIGKTLTENGAIKGVLFSPTRPQFISSIIVNNNTGSTYNLYLILSPSVEEISSVDYFQSEQIEPGTVYINVDIQLNGDKNLFVNSNGEMVITVIGND